MNSSIKAHIVVFASITIFSLSLTATAEETDSHKHYKATMPGASHAEYTERQSEEANGGSKPAAKPKHAMRNGVQMTGRTHREHIVENGNSDQESSVDTKKTHKHYKQTMKGEKHNP